MSKSQSRAYLCVLRMGLRVLESEGTDRDATSWLTELSVSHVSLAQLPDHVIEIRSKLTTEGYI